MAFAADPIYSGCVGCRPGRRKRRCACGGLTPALPSHMFLPAMGSSGNASEAARGFATEAGQLGRGYTSLQRRPTTARWLLFDARGRKSCCAKPEDEGITVSAGCPENRWEEPVWRGTALS